ncbi:MAG: hypothetical protein K8S99_11490 [Planctomycetes bacterium]|nr:hypothetical protein [Planctomycetota bacterium]
MKRTTHNPEPIGDILPRVLDRIAPKSRPVFVIRLRPTPGVDAVRALRRALKYCSRACGLRCVDVQELPAGETGKIERKTS